MGAMVVRFRYEQLCLQMCLFCNPIEDEWIAGFV